MATLTYDPVKGAEFCERLSTSSLGMETVCAELGLVPRTVWRWLSVVPEFWEMYTKSRDFQTELMYDEMSRIAGLPLTHNGEEIEDGGIPLEGPVAMAEVQRRKLIVDTMKFKLAKLQPKRFGENKNVAIDVKVSNVVTDTQFAKLLEAAKSAPVDAEDIDHEEIE